MAILAANSMFMAAAEKWNFNCCQWLRTSYDLQNVWVGSGRVGSRVKCLYTRSTFCSLITTTNGHPEQTDLITSKTYTRVKNAAAKLLRRFRKSRIEIYIDMLWAYRKPQMRQCAMSRCIFNCIFKEHAQTVVELRGNAGELRSPSLSGKGTPFP